MATTLNSLSHVLIDQRRYRRSRRPRCEEALDIARAASRQRSSAGRDLHDQSRGPCSWRDANPPRPRRCFAKGSRIRAHAPGVVPSRRRTFVEDDWSLGATKSLLGATLLALSALRRSRDRSSRRPRRSRLPDSGAAARDEDHSCAAGRTLRRVGQARSSGDLPSTPRFLITPRGFAPRHASAEASAMSAVALAKAELPNTLSREPLRCARSRLLPPRLASPIDLMVCEGLSPFLVLFRFSRYNRAT